MRLSLVAFSNVFERVIVSLLLVMLMILIVIGVGVLADLFVDFFRHLPSRLAQLDNVKTLQHEMHQAFGGFLVLLLGLELLTTVRMYLTDHMIHVETVFLVAMKDLRLLWRDRPSLFWILAWPLIFALFFPKAVTEVRHHGIDTPEQYERFVERYAAGGADRRA